MGLRLTEGVDIARIQALSTDFLNQNALERLKVDGLISHRDGRIATTEKGRPLTNAILRDLIN
jgi:oxygen-independent coproporphyrinogen-3 oxidase